MSRDAALLLDRLREAGVVLTVIGDTIRVTAPRGTVDPSTKASIRQHKAALVALLSPAPSRDLAATSGGGAVAPIRCFGCREHRFWRSIYGVVICAKCHPPADESLVVERLGEAVHAR
jgi:hypothetical protein